tara:strand:- start:24 stop:731 length:708 start_codon:yes stop_codon:yes gene_type:complete
MKLEQRLAESKVVFFDLFHTLFSFKSDGTAGRSTSEILGIPEMVWTDLLFDSSEERMRGHEHDRYAIIRKLAHIYDPSIDEDRIRLAADSRFERFSRGLKEAGGDRIEILSKLRASGKKIGLISNADSVEVSGWDESPLSRCFDSVIFSFATGYVKPEPEIYQIALDSLGVTAAEAIFVGDGGSDELRGAREVGLTTVMTTEIISNIWPEKIPDRAKYADYQISRLGDLISSELS